MSYSKEHKLFLKKRKREKILIAICQISIFVFLIMLWEFLAITDSINTFLTSSPSRVWETLVNLIKENN